MECFEIGETLDLANVTPRSGSPPAESALGVNAPVSEAKTFRSPRREEHFSAGSNHRTANANDLRIDWDTQRAQPQDDSDTATHERVSLQTQLPASPPGYDIIRRLGAGGMGDVFLAQELSTERTVAMKFLRASAHQVAIDRFLTEVRVLARLDHPNIIKIHASDFYRVMPFFTMEFAKGGTLSERIEKNGPLEPPAAARIIAPVARAIEAAHRAGVLHRDLKPSNILLDEGGVPKVADFGLAKRTDREEDLTLNSGPIGTLGFMPPEQMSRQHGDLGPTSDVYALGATLYYLLSGRRPYTGETPFEVAVQVETSLIDRLRALRAEIPPELEAIVLKCLEKEQGRRYSSASSLADDLDRYLAGKIPVAPQLTPRRRLQRWIARKRVVLASAILSGALLAGLGVLWPKKIDESQTPTPEATQAPEDFIREELKAGRSVELIGEKGLPIYHRWRLGGGGFGESITGDKTCYYESIGYTLLELVPDPGIDSYRVSLELRHLRAKKEDKEKEAQGDNKGKEDKGKGGDRTYIGPYFGHDELVRTGDLIPVHTLFAFPFADVVPNGPQGSNYVRFRECAISLSPLVDSPLNQAQLGGFKFKSNLEPMGAWRGFVIDVTPKRVIARWKCDDGSFETMFDAAGEKIDKWNNDFQKSYNKLHPRTPITIPAWSPRKPMGILSSSASLSVKKLTISPLPPP